MNSRNKSKLMLGILWILLACGYRSTAAQGTIFLQTQFPVQKENTRIIVQTEAGNPIPGAKVTATYRPGSRVQADSEVGITNSGGTVDWIPLEAGIVSISAEFPGAGGDDIQLQTNVSVRFASTPVSGIVIMLLAGILLIGGSIVRFSRYIWGEGF
jgi:hypothetical protein